MENWNTTVMTLLKRKQRILKTRRNFCAWNLCVCRSAVAFCFLSIYRLRQRRKKSSSKNKLSFFNPKAGMSWQINEKQQFCLSVAVAHKEPVRDDYVNSSPDSRPKAEALTDLEAGYRFSLKKFFFPQISITWHTLTS